MAIILFRLRNVPDDEADEVRQLLQQHHLAFYETPPGRWGLSPGLIWLEDESELDHAKGLLATYQQQRYEKARSEYETLKQQGKTETLLHRLRYDPVRTLFILAFVGFILFVMIKPFMDLMDR